jgi:mannuronan 5-epimerase
MMISKGFFVAAVAAVLIFPMTGISYPHMNFADGQEELGGACIAYDPVENTITITCDHASFRDVANTIYDPAVLEKLRGEDDREYLLNASLQINNGVTFSMTSNDGLHYLKIAGANGIIVNGKIRIDGVKITSWDPSTNDVVPQNISGSIRRAYIQFDASDSAEIINSEFAYLGYNELGRRGFDLFGDGGVSHGMEIKGSKFHHMWRPFYSTAAHNITIHGNEFDHNINYSVDPHSGTHDINITNNWIHDDPIGVICSLDCYNILIEGNKIDNITNAGIFFSRNMSNSIARNNHIHNASSGIIVSESSNNQIYNNTIEAANSEGVLLFNPAVPADGLTEGNIVYNNTISDSAHGIRASRSHDNILGDNKFYNLNLSEYLLTRNSTIIITKQDFDYASITAAKGSPMDNNTVEIASSGIIGVTELNHDRGINETKYYHYQYNTDDKAYRKVLSYGDSIMVNS